MTAPRDGRSGSEHALTQTLSNLGLSPELAAAGFNVAGVLSAERYDALVPPAWRSAGLLRGARSVVVLGCGGRAFGEAFLGSPEARDAEHPIDRFSVRVVSGSAAALDEGAAPGEGAAPDDGTALGGAVASGEGAVLGEASVQPIYYWEQRGGAFVDFVALGRAAGLGVPGRLGLLLHPVYGPWLSLRAALVTSALLPPAKESSGFAPCTDCPAPCAEACPGDAVAAEGFDATACAETTRVSAGCVSRCAARHACVIGREHAYAPEVEQRFRAAVVAYSMRQQRAAT